VSKPSRNPRPTSPTANPSTPPRATSSEPASRADAAAAAAAAATGAARRTRSAPASAPRPALERHRGTIIGLVVAAVALVGGAFVFLGASAPAYACTTILQPTAAPSPGANATARLGQVTRDLGRAHEETGARVTYEFCPPTSGAHYNDARFGPIATRFYGADDRTEPQGWIHNLEHGQMAVLYRCPEGCDETAQAALRTLQQRLPASPLCAFPAAASVPVTRFDDLPTPYAAVVWGRVLFLDSLDVAAIATFSGQSADRGPEPQCQNAVPGASPSAAPSATPAP
jgi:hypothetical protein